MHTCQSDNLTFSKNLKVLAAEDTNIQSILFSSPLSQLTVPSNRIIEAFIAFSWHCCDTKPALDVMDHAVTAAKASGIERHIALAVWCLGWTYAQIGDYDSSYNHLQ